MQDSVAQSPIEAKMVLVDALIKHQNSHELNLQLYIKNNSTQNYFIPKMLNEFSYQTRDTLSVYKIKEGADSLIVKLTGSKAISGVYSKTNFQFRNYSKLFYRKKEYGDSIAGGIPALKVRNNQNVLFISGDETFCMYHINTLDFILSNEGEYLFNFSLNVKSDPNLPEDIGGYKNYPFSGIDVKPLYISVKLVKQGSKLTIRDENRRKIRSFIWGFKQNIPKK